MQGGDIALAGFVLTAEEWHALDAISRAQLIAAAYHRDAPWLVPLSVSEPPDDTRDKRA